MSDLILDSLEIKNFRLFKHLEIERLGRVNLIVGKNSVGKTTLLEALRLYATRGDFSVIWEILSARDESSRISQIGVRYEVAHQAEALSYLFHGYPEETKISQPITVGPSGLLSKWLRITFEWESEIDMDDLLKNVYPAISVQYGEQRALTYRLDRNVREYLASWQGDKKDSINSVFSSAGGLSERQVEQLWEKAILAGSEKEVVKALRLINSEVQDLHFIGFKTGEESDGRIPVVSTKIIEKRIPLRSMGEGMNRLLGIALALVNAKDGILLIDEIESGLHYSVQPDMWRLIFETAAKLNVQVFATTHSWDCIEAFQEAAEAYPEEGVLISLRRKQQEEGIAAVLFDEKDLESVTRSYIEVR